MTQIYEKIKNFLTENESKIVLAVGLILIAAVAFESGYLKGKAAKNSPIVIEKAIPGQNLSPEASQGSPLEAQKSAQEGNVSVAGATIPANKCAFVGSKNSNKYHIPSSRCAKQIKPENLVCFSSVENALAKGYQAGCLK